MQPEDTFLELLGGVPEEVKKDIFRDISFDMVVRCYNYILSKSEDEKVVYPEDELLSNLGYDSDDKAFCILRDFVLYIAEAIEEEGIKTAYKLVKDENSYIYVELAHYDYEIGINTLKCELARIHSERKIDNVDVELYEDIFGKKKHKCNVFVSAILIAEYIKNKDKKTSSQTKTADKNKSYTLAIC